MEKYTLREVRPEIPGPVKREIRQRCGFGCVICGFPIYEYHHMTPWSEVRQHLANDITLLCSQHHAEVTKKLLTSDQISRANAMPHNKKLGVNKPYTFNYEGSSVTINFGALTITHTNIKEETTLSAMTINGKSLLFFQFLDGRLLLNLKLIDSETGNKLAIVNNELIYSTTFWDIQMVGRNLKIRNGNRSMFVDIDFIIPNIVEIRFLRLMEGNIEILVRDGGAYMRDVVSGDTVLLHDSMMNFSEQHAHAIVVGDAPVDLGKFEF